MHYLLETPVGVALFAYMDQIVLEARLMYESIDESTSAIDCMRHIRTLEDLPAKIVNFLRQNIKDGMTLNVQDPALCDVLRSHLGIDSMCKIDSVFRDIKRDSPKWFGVQKSKFEIPVICYSHRNKDLECKDGMLVEMYNMLEELEKNTNNRIMRIREWYSIHFPELSYVADNHEYINKMLLVKNRKDFILGSHADDDEVQSRDNEIRMLAKNSMGADISKDDLQRIIASANDVLKDISYRKRLQSSVRSRCSEILPNLHRLLGDSLSIRLVRTAGSLSRLASYAASTIQILGAEKAFNETVKCENNTPKHGIIYDSKFVSRIGTVGRGKMARRLANKIALCARVDFGKEDPSGEYGQKMHRLLENEEAKLLRRGGKNKKPVHQQKKRVISVADYDQARDVKKHKNGAEQKNE